MLLIPIALTRGIMEGPPPRGPQWATQTRNVKSTPA